MTRFLVALMLCLFTLPILAKNTILIIGDSLSASYGIAREKGWPLLLQQRVDREGYDYQVINLSISGDTTSNGLNRLPKALQQYKPQITIIELGGNDGLRGLQLETIKSNLKNMITLAKAENSKVLLLGVRLPPNLGPEYTQGFQNIFTDLARAENIQLISLFLNNIDDDSALMQPDGVHPTEKAQMMMVDNVWPTLNSMLINK